MKQESFMLQWCNSSREITKQHDARAKLLFVNTNILIFTNLLAVAVSVGFVVIHK